MKLTNEHRWGQSPLTDPKIGQNLDFLKLGQRRLGTSLLSKHNTWHCVSRLIEANRESVGNLKKPVDCKQKLVKYSRESVGSQKKAVEVSQR